MTRTVVMSGGPASGKTERLVWMTVGALLAGQDAVIACVDRGSGKQIEARVRVALNQVGVERAEAERMAKDVVITDGQRRERLLGREVAWIGCERHDPDPEALAAWRRTQEQRNLEQWFR